MYGLGTNADSINCNVCLPTPTYVVAVAIASCTDVIRGKLWEYQAVYTKELLCAQVHCT